MLAAGDGRILRSRLWAAAVVAVAAATLAACGSGSRGAPGAATPVQKVSNGPELPAAGSKSGRATPAPLGAGPRLSGGGTSASRGADAGSTASTVASVAGPTTTGQASAPGPPTCSAADLRVAFDVQPRGGIQPSARTRALVVLTDLTGPTCVVKGFATIEASVGGRPRLFEVSHVDQPGAPVAVVLQAGGSAFAGLEWTTAVGCPEVSAFSLILPGGGVPLPVGVVVPGGSGMPVALCAWSLELGPFAATSEGTVDFADSAGAGT
jgi:hypothetical protein